MIKLVRDIRTKQSRAWVWCVYLCISLSLIICITPATSATNLPSTIAANTPSEGTIQISFSVLGSVEKTVTANADGKVTPYVPFQSCKGKLFVGWSTVEVPSTNIAPTLIDLANHTFTASTTLYAVFACQNGGNTAGQEIEFIEDFESYPTSLNYNASNPRLLLDTKHNLFWSVFCGNVSTTDAIQGNSILFQTQSITKNESFLTVGPLHDLISFAWKAKNKNGAPMYVYYSVDGNDWKSATWNEKTTISTSVQNYNLTEIPTQKELYIRIATAYGKSLSRLFLDSFSIKTKLNTFFYTNYSTTNETLSPAKMQFDVNGGYEDIGTQDGRNQWITLPEPKRGAVPFLGWQVTDIADYTEVFPAGSKYLLNSDVTLQAQWQMQQTGAPLDIIDWSTDGVTINMSGKSVSKGIQCNGTLLNQTNYSGDNKEGDRTFFIPANVILSAPSGTVSAEATPQEQNVLVPGKDIWLNVQWNYSGDNQPHTSSIGYYRVPYIYASENVKVSTSLTKADDIVVRSGKAVITQDTHVRNIYVYPDAELEVNEGVTLQCSTIYLRTKPFQTAVFTNHGTLQCQQMYYTRICADRTAYYQLALPFSSCIADMRLTTGESLEHGKKWLVKRYDTQSRAEHGFAANNWVSLSAQDSLKAGVGYSMLSGSNWYREYCFPVRYSQRAQHIPVIAPAGLAAAENPVHAGWNYVCLPSTGRYVPGTAVSPESAVKVSELRQDNCTYRQHVPEQIDPAQPFYYQAAQAGRLVLGETMSFEPAATSESLMSKSGAAMPNADVPTQWLQLTLADSAGNSDETTIYLHPMRFDTCYMPQYDLIKMKGYGRYPMLYSVVNQRELSFNALPDTVGRQGICMGYYAPAACTMTLAICRNDYLGRLQHVYLLDRETNTTTDLLLHDYTFRSSAGEFSDRLVLQCRFVSDVSTATPTDTTLPNTPSKRWHNGRLYICIGEQCYDMLGNQCAISE